jgi:hypothetical protein
MRKWAILRNLRGNIFESCFLELRLWIMGYARLHDRAVSKECTLSSIGVHSFADRVGTAQNPGAGLLLRGETLYGTTEEGGNPNYFFGWYWCHLLGGTTLGTQSFPRRW